MLLRARLVGLGLPVQDVRVTPNLQFCTALHVVQFLWAEKIITIRAEISDQMYEPDEVLVDFIRRSFLKETTMGNYNINSGYGYNISGASTSSGTIWQQGTNSPFQTLEYNEYYQAAESSKDARIRALEAELEALKNQKDKVEEDEAVSSILDTLVKKTRESA